MAFKVQSFLLFFMLRVSVCDESTNTTITPLGSFIGMPGDLVSVNCTFPYLSGYLLCEYNGVESDDLIRIRDEVKTTTVTANSSTLTVKAVTLGPNPSWTGVVVQLNFTLAADHSGSTLRCKFLSALDGVEDSESNIITFTALYPPCCNASSPMSVSHNTTDPDPFLPLNCSEIVGSRGNLPASVEWTVRSSNPNCIGKTTDCCDEFYNISSIGRECDGVTIECMAKNDEGFTRKIFNLAVKSAPGKPEFCISRFIGRNQGASFRWRKPKDGGFPVENYNVSVYVNDVISKSVSVKERSIFVFEDGKEGDRIKFSVSANNALGQGLTCTSDIIIPFGGRGGRVRVIQEKY